MIYSFRIEQAVRAAGILHDGQSRRGSIPYPYVTHLFSVTLILCDYTNDEDTIIAGLLHDTLEDTDYTGEELERDFGPRVRKIVEGVTEGTLSERKELSWKKRKEQYLKRLAEAPVESLIVATADHIHNMRSLIEAYDGRIEALLKDFSGTPKGYRVKYARFHALIIERLDHPIVKEFELVYEQFSQFLDRI